MKPASLFLPQVSVANSRPRIDLPSKAARQTTVTELPAVSPLLLRWFTCYSRRYLRKHFHSLRISRSGPPPCSNLPLVIYTNHASWWDPLVGLILKAQYFPEHQAFTPIDATALLRYRFFRKLGFFGVEQGTRRGAWQFLRISETVLRNPNHILAVTPQSQFADVRQRPVRFRAGLGHLAARIENAVFVPMATEYVFWEERLPEILVLFGDPVLAQNRSHSTRRSESWTALFEQKLTDCQDALSQEAQQRQPNAFQTILRGGAGQGGIYDLWQTAKARWQGRDFVPEHGNK